MPRASVPWPVALVLAVLLSGCAAAPPAVLIITTEGGHALHAAAAASDANASAWWRPAAQSRFDYSLKRPFTVSSSLVPGVTVYVSDCFDSDADEIAALRARGGAPVGYFSAGSREDWRPDAGSFAAADVGAPLDGWPGERWLDVRSAGVRDIMLRRMSACKAKGFVAVDPDNVDGFANPNGLPTPLTADDQLDYNRWLAAAAHGLGLGVGLKNDVGQIQARAAGVRRARRGAAMRTVGCCDLPRPAHA
jgi:hypothetical protein